MEEKMMIPENKMIVAKDLYYDMDCYKTKRNNNLLVVGAAGTGKTRSIVTPNLLQATGSYILSDPKGSLYKEYKSFLEQKGYKVKLLNFDNPKDSIGYNFFRYIKSEIDILKIAHMLVCDDGGASFKDDPFWDNAGENLLVAIIAYLWEFRPYEEQNMNSVLKLLEATAVQLDSETMHSPFDEIMKETHKRKPNCLAYRSYQRYYTGTYRTRASIVITLTSKFSIYGFEDIQKMIQRDETDIPRIGHEKTALFVQVSDTDRSMDNMANLFFTQAMRELCYEADHNCEGYKLPIDVRFILDDFATNCKIHEFPRMISSIRSRGLSTMIMIQAESQLRQGYGNDANTIIANCDTYAYLGGNDLENASQIAERVNLPLDRVLYMPIEKAWVFRRGEKPIFTDIFSLEENLSHWLNKEYYKKLEIDRKKEKRENLPQSNNEIMFDSKRRESEQSIHEDMNLLLEVMNTMYFLKSILEKWIEREESLGHTAKYDVTFHQKKQEINIKLYRDHAFIMTVRMDLNNNIKKIHTPKSTEEVLIELSNCFCYGRNYLLEMLENFDEDCIENKERINERKNTREN